MNQRILQPDRAQVLMRALIQASKPEDISLIARFTSQFQHFFPKDIPFLKKNGHLVLMAIQALICLLKEKKVINYQTFRKYLSVSLNNMHENRFLNLITHSLSHVSLSHLLVNILLFFTPSQLIAQSFGAKRLFLVYIAGAIVGGIAVYINQKKNRDDSSFYGSNAGYSALAGYMAMTMPQIEFSLMGWRIPVWLKSLISVLCCISQKSNNQQRNSGKVEFSGFLAGIVISLLQQGANNNETEVFSSRNLSIITI